MNTNATRLPYSLLTLLSLLLAFFWCAPVILAQTRYDAPPNSSRMLSQRTMKFTENRGQIVDEEGNPARDVLYRADSRGVSLFLSRGKIIYMFSRVEGDPLFGERLCPAHQKQACQDGDDHDHAEHAGTPPVLHLYRMDLALVGADPLARVTSEEKSSDYMNFYLGHCPDGITRVPSYRKVTYHEIYPGIDMVISSEGGGAKIDFVVRPGGDPERIRMRYEGADLTKVLPDGSLRIENRLGYLHEGKPISYQESGGVTSSYRVRDGVIGFEVGRYDRNATLVIDPFQQWATYYGGSGQDDMVGGDPSEVDRRGNVMICGQSTSNFPLVTRPGGYTQLHSNQPTSSGFVDAFVVKFDGFGQILWSTYYGGNGADLAHGVSTDTAGNVLVAGHTESPSTGVNGRFPTQNAHQPDYGGLRDAFVVKFNPDGIRQWATYVGGSQWDDGYGFGIDTVGNAVVLVTAGSSGLGTLNAKPNGAGSAALNYDLLLVKFDPDGNRLWSRYYAGNGNAIDYGYAVASDVNENVIITGWTSGGLPLQTPAQPLFGGGGFDGFVAKFNGAGTLLWSTYIGGNGVENSGFSTLGASAVTTDSKGNVLVTGGTTSANFPTTAGAFQFGQPGGGQDGFLVKYDTNGVVQWATYFGGNRADFATGVASNANGGALITGQVSNGGLPTNQPGMQAAFQAAPQGGSDAFIAKFDRNGAIKWVTYFGGPNLDIGSGISYDPFGSIIIAGYTESNMPFPSPFGMHNIAGRTPAQGTFGGGGRDAYASLFCDPDPPPIDSSGPTRFCYNDSLKLSVLPGYQEVKWFRIGAPADLLVTMEDTLRITESGRYYVRVRNISECVSYSDTIEVVRMERMNPTLSADKNPFCDGDSTALRVGPRPFASYQWSRDGVDIGTTTTGFRNVKLGGLYKVRVTDITGCVDSAQLTVTNTPMPSPLTISATDTVLCEGESTMLIASGGTPGTITWSPTGASGSTSLTVNKTGLYYATARGPNGCSVVSNKILVKVNPRPVPRIIPVTPTVFCDPDSCILSVQPTINTPNARYRWLPSGDTTQTIVVRESGDITVELTDTNGCTGTAVISVTRSSRPKPVLTLHGRDTICEGDSVRLEVAPGMGTYIWPNGSPFYYTYAKQSGRYFAIVRNEYGCEGYSDTVTITVVPRPVATINGPVAVCLNSSASYSVARRAGGRYQWKVAGGGGSITSGIGSDAIEVKWGSGGNGTVECFVTDTVSGCSAWASITVKVGADLVPAITSNRSLICPGDSTLLDAGPGFSSYLWTPGGETTRTITVRKGGAYSVTVADPGGCRGTSLPFTVTEASAPLPQIKATATFFCPGDTVYLDAGSNAYTQYFWEPMNLPIARVAITKGGTYRVTVTDTNGCSGSSEITVTMNTPPAPVIDGPNSVCIDAVETYSVPGRSGNDYRWEVSSAGTILSGQGSERITVQWGSAGNATVDVTETDGATGCVGTAAQYGVMIDSELHPMITASKSTPLCEVDSVLLSAPSGYASYRWEGEEPGLKVLSTEQSLKVFKPGIYRVHVTNGTGCQGSGEYTVMQKAPLMPQITPNGTSRICEGDSILLEAPPGYISYRWAPNGETTRGIVVSRGGTYSVTVVDADGCIGSSAGVELIVNPTPAAPEITANGDTLFCPAAMSYQWIYDSSEIAGANGGSYITPVSGLYRVRIVDSNGCIALSAPFSVEATATATLALPTVQASPGERVTIPVELASETNLARTQARSFIAQISFDKGLLIPTDHSLQSVVRGGDRVISVQGEWQQGGSSGPLLTLEFIAALGDKVETPLRIESFQWLNGSSELIPAEISIVDGLFRLADLCENGGTRLVNAAGEVALKPARPNPTAGMAEIEYEVIEEGETQLLLVDLLGRPVMVLVDGPILPGRYLASFDASTLASGSYLCILRTPTQRLSQVVRIEK